MVLPAQNGGFLSMKNMVPAIKKTLLQKNSTQRKKLKNTQAKMVFTLAWLKV